MQRGVGILLRIDHPDQHVNLLHQPIDLPAVTLIGRIVVGQVHQHQPTQDRIVALHQVAPGDVQPIKQLVGQFLAPVGGHGPVGGGTFKPRLGQPGTRQGVEQAGLARTGCPGQGDDGVVAGERQTTINPVHHLLGTGHEPIVQPPGHQFGCLG